MYQVIISITPSLENRYTDRFFALGAGSITRSRESGKVLLTALFEKLPDFSDEPDMEYCEIRELSEEEWKYGWMEDLEGFEVNENLYIQPSHKPAEIPSQYALVLHLDLRDAFGDGRHPTTALCLEMLYREIDGIPAADRENLRMLDAGTGTGILAILAGLMGAGHVTALDLEAEAVRRAAENAALNGLTGIAFRHSDLGDFHSEEGFDIITANLLTRVITAHLSILTGLLKKGGRMIISGVGIEGDAEVRRAFWENRLRLISSGSREDWHGYLVEKDV